MFTYISSMKRITIIAGLLLSAAITFASAEVGSVSDNTSELSAVSIDHVDFEFHQVLLIGDDPQIYRFSKDGLPSVFVAEITGPAVPTFDKKTLRMWLYHKRLCMIGLHEYSANSFELNTNLRLLPLA